MALASLSVTEKLSPNTMELQKMVANGMTLLAALKPLTEKLSSPDSMQVDSMSEE